MFVFLSSYLSISEADELKRHPNPQLQINYPPANRPHLYFCLI